LRGGKYQREKAQGKKANVVRTVRRMAVSQGLTEAQTMDALKAAKVKINQLGRGTGVPKPPLSEERRAHLSTTTKAAWARLRADPALRRAYEEENERV
jgi:hypothetical protein